MRADPAAVAYRNGLGRTGAGAARRCANDMTARNELYAGANIAASPNPDCDIGVRVDIGCRAQPSIVANCELAASVNPGSAAVLDIVA